MRIRLKYSRRNNKQQGYILLSLLLMVALLAIAAAAIVPSITFQVQRDHEEELIHRGVQYSRAIRKYFKKFGRYPVSLDDLKNTNNIRFLRKRYKDPITGKDFKLLHFGEVQMIAGGGMVQGATPVSAMPDANKPDAAADADPNGDKTAKKDDSTSPTSSSSASPQTFGGGPIVGVISTSKMASIREFNGKNHYNQWQFIYDPGTDQQGMINTPAQPPLKNAVSPDNNVNGNSTIPGLNNNNTFGTSPGSQPAQTAPAPAPTPQPDQSQPPQQ